MSWWGKVAGGAFGFMVGGPLGALLGAALGHSFDVGLKGIDEDFGEAQTERIQTAFFTASFAIMGYLAKSDGRVSEHEIQMARQVMDQMQLNEEQKLAAIKLFNQGKAEDFDADAIIAQFRQECHRRRHLLQIFLEIQIATVMSDGRLHAEERRLLLDIAATLGFSTDEVDMLLKMVDGQQSYQNYSHYHEGRSSAGGAPPAAPSLGKAYAVLGVNKDCSDAELKKAYRRLMNQHHPDKLVAKGLPEEMMRLATEKTQEIKLAYEQIKKARKLN